MSTGLYVPLGKDPSLPLPLQWPQVAPELQPYLSKFCLCPHMAFSESQSFCVISSDTRTLVTGFRAHPDNLI